LGIVVRNYIEQKNLTLLFFTKHANFVNKYVYKREQGKGLLWIHGIKVNGERVSAGIFIRFNVSFLFM
jgi:hypothetical protein